MNGKGAKGKAKHLLCVHNNSILFNKYTSNSNLKRMKFVFMIAFAYILFILCNYNKTWKIYNFVPVVQAASHMQTCRYINITNPFGNEIKVRLKNTTTIGDIKTNLTEQ